MSETAEPQPSPTGGQAGRSGPASGDAPILPDLLAAGVRRHPEGVCVVEGERSLTFAEVHRRAAQLADALRRFGVKPGDRVAVLAHNELEYLEIGIGVNRAGAVLLPLNYRLAIAEFQWIVEDASPSLLIHGPGYDKAAAELGIPTWHLGSTGFGDPYEDRLADSEPNLAMPVHRSDALAQVMYTSGTTGRPKGALMTHMNLWARFNMFAIEMSIKPHHVFVQGLPMFHIASHTGAAFTYVGASQVVIPTFEPQSVLDAISTHRATHLLLVPTMMNMLANNPATAEADLSSLELLQYGASPISPDVVVKVMAAFGCDLMQFYGMTETSGTCMLRPELHDPVNHPELLASAGSDSVSYETRVVDEDDNDVPPRVVGEIISRSPGNILGYWNNPEATDAALRGGWMHTGDLGYFDEGGHLFVADRLKDMIVSGGENVYPREVEDVIYGHPDVFEVAVIGIPDDKWGERVHAVVSAMPGTDPSPDSIIAHCRTRLAGYKVPKTVSVVPELPKNPTGKILKRELRREGELARGVDLG